ncbi:MAG: C45 family peptidase [Acetobacterales bacterium]
MTDTVPLIEVSGPPRERGRQYGEQARDRVIAACELFRGIMEKGGRPWPAVKERAQGFAPRIEAYCPAYLEEIAGIAEGAGVETEALILLNARNEMMLERAGEVADKDIAGGDECTSVVCLPETTADGHLIHAQNWDYREDCIDVSLVLKVEPEDGPSFLTFTIAGGLARCGLNSAGVAITGNNLVSDRDGHRTGVPLALIRRRVLESRIYADALGAVLSAPVAASNNMTVSTAQGDAINFEAAPEECFWLYPEDGMVVHANHFRSEAAKAKLRDLGAARSPCTLYRDRRVESLLRPRAGSITVDDVFAALADDFGAPRAVCRPPVPRRDGSFSTTAASIVMDVTAGRMWVRMAPWREGRRQSFDLGARPVAAAAE